MLKAGDKAPKFDLPTYGGGQIALSEFAGRNVVVYFYPKDMTPGCTREALDFTALAPAFEEAGTVVIGISKDSVARHGKFRDKYDLKIHLASDEDGAALDAYGVWKEKSLYGRSFMGIVRSTFLIDGNGIIQRVWDKVRVKGHAEDVLAAAREL